MAGWPRWVAGSGAGIAIRYLLVRWTIPLDAVPGALKVMGSAPGAGVTVIEPWG